MKSCDKNFIEAVMEEVNSVYACLALTLDDAEYIQAVVYEILSRSLEEQGKWYNASECKQPSCQFC